MRNASLNTLKQSFDPAKSDANKNLRGFGFEIAQAFEFDSALIVEDDRADYGEIRYVGLGFVGERMHVIVFTMRDDLLRIISLRKANKREIKRYVEG
ncbi:MAG: BrnT family toxin [Rhizobiaceae bacterium]|nr:BrnT family toxin [Rhizobiaceae bacterium]